MAMIKLSINQTNRLSLLLFGLTLLTNSNLVLATDTELPKQSVESPEATTTSIEQTWTYQQHIHPTLPPVIIKFIGLIMGETVANIKAIEFYKEKEIKPFQIIQPLDTKTWFDETGLNFKLEDVNFDNYQDLRLMVDIPTGPIPYLCWLFDPKTGQFVHSQELSGLASLEVDAANKQIVSYWKSNEFSHGTNYYQFIAGKLTLIRQEITEYLADTTGSYQLTILERVGDEMKVIEQRHVQESNAQDITNLTTLIKEIWQNLDKTAGNCLDEVVSATMKESAVLQFYCQINQHFLDYAQLQQLINVPIFLKGPHSDKQLNLNAEHHFGYYNEAFVKWLKDHFIPAAQDPAFRTATQPLFDNYVKPIARTFYLVHELLFDDLEYLKQEQATYLKYLHTHQLPANYILKYQDFKGLKAQGFSERDIAIAVAFWIRRMIDGTANEFFAGLKLLMMTYDTTFAVKQARQTPKWTYQIPLHTRPPTLTFKLFNLDQDLANGINPVAKIEIYRNNDVYPFQTIQEPKMRMIEEDEGFETEDMNFDGYQDIRIARDNLPSLYWLFDSGKQLFVRNTELEQIEQHYGMPTFDSHSRQIKLVWREGSDPDWEAGIHGINYYQFKAGKLVLIRQELYHVFWEVSAEENVFEELHTVQEFTIITILMKSEMIDGEMEVIEQKLVPGNLVREKFSSEYESIDEEAEVAHPQPRDHKAIIANEIVE